MNVIKGFALNRNFVDNAPGVVAEIGELSALGWSYHPEPRVYSSPTYPTISLAHFPTKDSGVGTSAPIPDAQKEHILKVASLIYQRSGQETRVIAPGEFVEYLISQMGADIADISVGGSVVSGNRSIVEWVQWRNPAVTDDNVNKVWFSNGSFCGQFDEYSLIVIPPFLPVDNFFPDDPETVKTLLKGSYQDLSERIQAAKEGTNESFFWGKEYNYVNPLNRNDKTPAKFTVLGFGMAGNNIDIIKESIVQYLLANSTHTRDEWKNILPDLFLRTEFYLYPSYDRVAIENVVNGNNAIYSPVLSPKTKVAQMVSDAFGYDADHVTDNCEIFTFPYMSVGVGSIGHIENRDSKMKISDWFPDYFFTNNGSADFNRMSLLTQKWVLMIAEMMPIARDMTSGSTVPIGFSRVIRGTKMYLSKSYNDIQFLVAAKAAP